MRKIINKLVGLTLLLNLVACHEKLDTVALGTNKGAYMTIENSKVVFVKNDQQGETFIEPRLSHLASEDTKLTISAQGLLDTYNKTNNTLYESLPTTQYTLYEVDNPSNTSNNGTLTLTIKKGSYSSKVGVRVNPMDENNFPFSKKYAILMQIASVSSNTNVLTNKNALITFDRPFKTNVVQIPRGQAFIVDLAEEVPDSENITIQAQYMFDEMTTVNGSTINMGFYGRLLKQGIQIKDGGTDTDFHKPGGEEIKTGVWYQITFVITKDKKFKIYFNGKLEQTLERSVAGISKAKKVRSFTVGNADYGYTHKYKIREVRLWNRALTEAEINDNLYLPIDPNTEGLVAYVPLNNPTEGFVDKSKYANTIAFGKRQFRNSTKEEFEREVKWFQNVKFPAETLVIEN